MASLMIDVANDPKHVGNKWVLRFVRRHPKVKNKLGKKINNARVLGCTEEVIEAHMKHFAAVLDKIKVLPRNTYNMDETGLNLGVYGHQTYIRTSASTRCIKRTPETREWVTIVEAVSAEGRAIKPLVIFKGGKLQSTWFDDEIPNFLYTSSPCGYSDNTIGLRWLREVFLPETYDNDLPRLLILDGHGSHYTEEFMLLAIQNNVKLFYLLPHSSHVTQPLDVCGFSPIKTRY